jgi:hypothetical protein
LEIDGHNITPLFDLDTPPIPFSNPATENIPQFGSIIYTVWNTNNDFIYVGIGGVKTGVPLSQRNPRSRISQHSSGARSGDQFCVYVQDFFVIPEIVKSETYAPEKGLLDKLTKEYIHKNLSYRFVVFQDENSIEIVRSLESKIKRGESSFGNPFLNGTE